ncbi:DUF6797 domain-containing protein [Runella slithyformis]|uniref:Cytochrome c domain-containing protein n=1 Tax=Runella slithyformis (strain ATCC 29530 / DSM 19594 / LMG 11500 / NCIMB 11436 / LSU 4) TaxID=761193 RepID=A0A7U3ZNN8_RUNSL|nr:DUF6797 domain-containing protein [Runella slithyformis]AEI50554.1 hypothetical protein Runsl_4210 [Runella slithyformis DSM 19594]
MKKNRLRCLTGFALVICFFGFVTDSPEGSWECTITPEGQLSGILKLKKEGTSYSGTLFSFERGEIVLQHVAVDGNKLTGSFMQRGAVHQLTATVAGETLTGSILSGNKRLGLTAKRIEEPKEVYTLPKVQYILSDDDLNAFERHIDHSGLIERFNREGYTRGERIYNDNCINCHGNQELEGSIPMAHKFWSQPFKGGRDPFSMYRTISKGYGSMPPQLTLTPQEKYDVISYIRENFIRETNQNQYFRVTPGYLFKLPKGDSKGPAVKPYHPWSDMDYGNFFINTYELADSATGIKRFHSPGRPPYVDEDYRKNNFAYKGIAVRLDPGTGGVSAGKAWMVFDHDVMRVAGGWTGEGFIDWEGILLNDKHETYPRNIGQLHFETPGGPGWANPVNGSFDDPRFTARDGRQFGPLPKEWANYKGLYHYGNTIIISYTVGKAMILEKPGMETVDGQPVFTRTLTITPANQLLKTRVARGGTHVIAVGKGAAVKEENGYVVLTVTGLAKTTVKLFISKAASQQLTDFVAHSPRPESLERYTKGGKAHYPQTLHTVITRGKEDGLFAVDQLTPPYENPWKSRMKLSGIDFMKNPNEAVLCTTDGDVWKVTGLTDANGNLRWKRIASGLFQPLGIKVLNEKIYITCRDQLVLLRDLNGDGETDFYESFNHDHQVTDHFHEFAMGLQADKEGNLYYAKSGRHAREALIPQHGTLLKVSKDGAATQILATGFRAANGVCINPDGSFIVTDQQGYWNPMNRVNWVDGKGKFYGNMWGYNPPKDSTKAAMEQPLVWIDMEFDRSPSELLWVDSKKWGPLNGGLLSFSYGYGKIQLVLTEDINGQKQGGVIDLPGVKFRTGIMRGRFNPADGQLYACGMSAWGTSQTIKGGDFYRLRYTGKSLTLPTRLSAEEEGVTLTFADALDETNARTGANFTVQTWDLRRSRKYGSERYNTQTLTVSEVKLSRDKKIVKLILPGIKPVDVMTISYSLTDSKGHSFKGKVQNTIHALKKTDNRLF